MMVHSSSSESSSRGRARHSCSSNSNSNHLSNRGFEPRFWETTIPQMASRSFCGIAVFLLSPVLPKLTARDSLGTLVVWNFVSMPPPIRSGVNVYRRHIVLYDVKVDDAAWCEPK